MLPPSRFLIARGCVGCAAVATGGGVEQVKPWIGIRTMRAVFLRAAAGFLLLLGGCGCKYTPDGMVLSLAVEDFARYYGRMPKSLEELIENGYLRPAVIDGEKVYRYCHSVGKVLPPKKATKVRVFPADIRDLSAVSFAWGVKPEDLILRGGRLYWRKQPDKEALLVRGRTWTVSERDRRWTLDIYKAMLEGAKRRASQSAPASQQSRPGAS